MADPKAPFEPAFTQLSPEEEAARANRNRWLGLALFGFVMIVGVITAIRLADAAKTGNVEFYYHYDDDGEAIEGDGTVALPPGMAPEEAEPEADAKVEAETP